MSKVGKRYKRTDELVKKLRSELPETALIALYDNKEEFAANQSEFANLNPTEGFIPRRVGNAFVDSALEEQDTKIVSGKTIETPGGSLQVGSALLISDFGGTPQFINQPFDESFVPVMNQNDVELGSELPIYREYSPKITVTAQPIFADEFNGTLLQFNPAGIPTITAVIDSTTLKGGSVDTQQFRITVRRDSFTGPVVWRSHNDVEFSQGGGFFIPANTEVIIAPVDPIEAREGVDQFVTYEAAPDTTINLLGEDQGFQFSPFVRADIRIIINRQILTNNTIIVIDKEDFPAPIAGVIQLEDSISYLVSGEIDLINDTLKAGLRTLIQGFNPLTDTIITDSPNALIEIEDQSVTIKTIRFANADGDIFNLIDNTGITGTLIESVTINTCASIGTFDSPLVLSFRSVSLLNSTVNGAKFVGNVGQLNITRGFNIGWAGPLYDLGTATFASINISGNNRFLTSPSNTVLKGLTAGANISTGGGGFVGGNAFLGTGTFLDGIDVCDDKWRFAGNLNITDTAVGIDIFVAAGDEARTTIVNQDTPVAVAGTFTTDLTCKFTANAAGLITYTASEGIFVNFIAKYLAAPAMSNNIVYTGHVQKNGTGVIDVTRDTIIGDSISPVKMVILGTVRLAQNDTLQLVIENNSNTVDVDCDAVNFVVTQM